MHSSRAVLALLVIIIKRERQYIIMSLSAKNVYTQHRGNPTPAITCFIIFRIFIIAALIVQLVDSIPSGDDHRHPYTKNSEFNLKSPDFEVSLKVFHGVDSNRKNTDESNRNIPMDQNPYNSYSDSGLAARDDGDQKISKSDEELVSKAIRNGIFLTAEQWEIENKRQFESGQRNIGQGVRSGGNELGFTPGDIFIPKVSPECEGSTVCETIDSYPTDYVKEIVKNFKDLKLLAGTEAIGDVGERINGDDTDNLCQSIQSPIYPPIVRKDPSDGNSWHFVVNVDTYKQGFIIETCLNPDGECRKIGGLTDFMESGYSAVCKQQQSLRKVVVLSRDNGTVIVGDFPFRSGCCCHVKRFADRFGGDTKNSSHPFSLFYGRHKQHH